MKVREINRIVIAVWDLDKAVALYSELLGAEFYEVSNQITDMLGARVALSFDGKMEILAPIPGRESKVELWLNEHGEGIQGVIYDMDDVEEARANAEKMGLQIIREIDLTEEEIKVYHGGRFKKFKEYFIDSQDVNNIMFLLGQFEQKH